VLDLRALGAVALGVAVVLSAGSFMAAFSTAVARAADTAEMVASAAERSCAENALVGWPVGAERIHWTTEAWASSGKAGITPRGLRICFRTSSSVNFGPATRGAMSEPSKLTPWHRKHGSPPAATGAGAEMSIADAVSKHTKPNPTASNARDILPPDATPHCNSAPMNPAGLNVTCACFSARSGAPLCASST